MRTEECDEARKSHINSYVWLFRRGPQSCGLHQPMGVPDIRKFKHFCRLRPVSAVGNAIDDCLKRNFGKRKRRRSSDERAREDAEMAAARHLKYGFERKRIATAE